MKKLDLPILFLTAAMLAVGPSSTTSAQADPQILTVASFDELTAGVTPRELGLGNNLLVDGGKGSNIEIARSNPSALNVSGSLNAVAGHTFYAGGPDDIAATYLTVARPFGQTNVALSFNLWDTSIGPINEILYSPPSPSLAEPLQHSRRVVILGSAVAQQLSENLTVGANIKGLRLTDRTWDETRTPVDLTATALVFDAGATYTFPKSGFRLAMTVNNLGVASAEDNGDRCEGSGVCTQSEYAEADLPPAGINIGGAYTLQPQNDVTLTLLSSAHLLPGQPQNIGGGLEIGVRDQFFLRGGLKDNRLYTSRFWDNEDYWYAGAGINVPLGSSTIRLDYAYSPATDFDGVHAFSAGVNF